jgi:hypothetical protein
MKIDGGCYCGEIRYEAEVDPEKVVLCNCTDCQTMSGGTCHVNLLVAESDFRLVSGTPAEFVKTAESGRQRVMVFCGVCGTQLYATSPEGPRVFGLRVPTSRQREQLVPKQQVWHRSRPSWLRNLDGIPATEEQ